MMVSIVKINQYQGWMTKRVWSTGEIMLTGKSRMTWIKTRTADTLFTTNPMWTGMVRGRQITVRAMARSYLQTAFGERFISRESWPPLHQIWTHVIDFWLWGNLKATVYSNNLCNKDNLKVVRIYVSTSMSNDKHVC